MRYFGKQGPQCDPVVPQGRGRIARCRGLLRCLLFGRVPRQAVLLLGSVILLLIVLAGVCSLSSVSSSSNHLCRDFSAAVMTHR